MRGTAAERTRRVAEARGAADDAGRKRAAVELIAREGEQLRRTARRYSVCAEDAEDAYQRGLEILLTKAPTERPRELLAWTTTVVKHEALAVRRTRERLLGSAPANGRDGPDGDWMARLASPGAGPLERLERREEIARSREAIRALKPAERQALALLGEGYSYAEIAAITGFSRTKVNRCLAEGRERFRQIVASSEDGSRCAELRPLLSAFCDGEAGPADSRAMREHLRACGRCRATVRAYRAAPPTVAALCPLPLALAGSAAAKGGGGILGAAKSALAGLGKAAGTQKALAICAVGGATACVATGVVPAPKAPSDRSVAPRVERIGAPVRHSIGGREKSQPSGEEKARRKRPERPARKPLRAPPPGAAQPTVEPAAPEAAAAPVEAAPSVEPEPAPAPAPAPPPGAGSAAGEFGP